VKIILLTFILLSLFNIEIYSQSIDNKKVENEDKKLLLKLDDNGKLEKQDTIYYSQHSNLKNKQNFKYEKNYWIPAVGILGINGTLGAFNRYITKATYAYINKKSIKENFRVGWVWDDDNFDVNQIGHPYQGGMYYSMAKYYGHGYLLSMAYTTFGSLQWEYFMETEYPAINDLVTTSFGGAMMGDMLYHLGEKVLDDRSVGAERFFRELGAGIVSPILGLNRLLHGESFSSSPTMRRTNTNNNIKTVFFVGGKIFKKGENAKDTIPEMTTGNIKMNLVYGNPYNLKNPFDFFLLDLGLNISKNFVEDFRAQGVLWNKRLSWLTDRTLFGVFNNYDFVSSSIYKIGATSFGFGLGAIYPINSSHWNFIYNVQLNGIVMGGASTEYYFVYERDYNLGSGAGIKIIIGIAKPNFGRIRLKVDRYWIHTMSGTTGDEFIGLGTAEIDKHIWKNFGLSFAYNFYDRFGFYKKYNKDLDDIKVNANEWKLFATYVIK